MMTIINTTKQRVKQSLNWIKKNKRNLLNLLKWGILTGLFVAITFLFSCRLEVNAHIYLRNWLSPPQPVIIEPLSSRCFNNLPANSPYYQGNQKFSVNFVPGLPVWEEYTCYDFAALFKPQRNQDSVQKTFHTYWSSNSTSNFSDNQLSTLRSFVATQNVNNTLIVWIQEQDEERLTASANWKYIHEKESRKRITYKVIQPLILTKDTAIEPFVNTWRQLVENEENDGRGRDDLLRMLVLYKYGGVWFDLDTLFVRNLEPLFEHEWISQGSCSTGMFGNPFTGALFHFHKQSPYVCEILEGATDLFNARLQLLDSTSTVIPQKRYLIKGPEIFGSKLYYRIYRRVLHHTIKPWSILPWCFTDPSQCKRGNSLPSLFSNSNFDEKRVRQTFAYHWRDKWSSVPGSIFKFLDNIHFNKINW